MRASSKGFFVLNRLVNPVVRLVLRSPLHPVLSRRLALITVTGESSRSYHSPRAGFRAFHDFLSRALPNTSRTPDQLASSAPRACSSSRPRTI
jgi:hypothetical protein